MSAARDRGEAGYTYLEITVASALALTALIVVGSLVGTTGQLTRETRNHTRVSAEHGRNLRAIGNVLRSIDIRTLGGFDAKGTSTSPTFQRVSGADLSDRYYEGVERIVWRPSSRSVWNVKRPGALFLVGPAGERRIAANVPQEGFLVRQEGNSLAVRLTTYYSLGAQQTIHLTSETAISLRN